MTADTAAMVSREGSGIRSIMWHKKAMATGDSGSSKVTTVDINARYPESKSVI